MPVLMAKVISIWHKDLPGGTPLDQYHWRVRYQGYFDLSPKVPQTGVELGKALFVKSQLKLDHLSDVIGHNVWCAQNTVLFSTTKALKVTSLKVVM
jgi:hypothetical protein